MLIHKYDKYIIEIIREALENSPTFKFDKRSIHCEIKNNNVKWIDLSVKFAVMDRSLDK